MKLMIRTSTKRNPNAEITGFTQLPMRSTTRVRVEAVGRHILLFLNGTLDGGAILSDDRLFGDADLYVSDPWAASAYGVMGPILMSPLSKLTEFKQTETKDMKVCGSFQKTSVPQNFSLSFDINPSHNQHWLDFNILHYAQNSSSTGAAASVPGKQI